MFIKDCPCSFSKFIPAAGRLFYCAERVAIHVLVLQIQEMIFLDGIIRLVLHIHQDPVIHR